MTGVEPIVRRMFAGRTRRWSVTIITVLVLIVFGLPAADEYFARQRLEAELTEKLLQAEHQVERIDDLRGRAGDVEEQLQRVQAGAMLGENEQAFRQSLVAMTRTAGCQLRRLNMATANTREWGDDDHPLHRPKPKRGKKQGVVSPYQLRTQGVSISVSGTLKQTQALLAELRASGKLLHTSQLSIRPTGGDRNNVVMEMQFTLFGIEKSKAAPTSA